MSLELGNLLGAAANVTAALQDDQKSLKSFLTTVNDFGVQVKNNFEVNFSGLEDITFFVHSIQLPGLHQNFTEIYYNGSRVDIPINHEYDHEFSLVVLNDAQGYIYSALTEFLANTSSNVLANSGYTMASTAGALNIQLIKKDTYILGDNNKKITSDDISKAVNLSKLSIILFTITIIILFTLIYVIL